MIESFIRDYVAFSGQNFPYVLVPLLAQENVMFNINRPLVIYESMTLSFDHLDFQQASVEMLEPKMEVNGKRATAFLHFQIKAGGDGVGTGFNPYLTHTINIHLKTIPCIIKKFRVALHFEK